MIEALTKSQTLPIVYQDQWLVVVDKPAGLMVHRSELSPGVDVFATDIVSRMVGHRVHPVHRLDRPTSGLLVFALDRGTLKAVSGQFARREVHKSYRALVRGFLEHQGRIASPLAKASGSQKKEAITLWRRLWQIELPHAVGRYATARYSMLELHPKTGRFHQIRRHMAHLRHPIIGDTSHGDRHHNRFFRENLNLPGLFLWAHRLTLSHPESAKKLELETKTPDRFARLEPLRCEGRVT